WNSHAAYRLLSEMIICLHDIRSLRTWARASRSAGVSELGSVSLASMSVASDAQSFAETICPSCDDLISCKQLLADFAVCCVVISVQPASPLATSATNKQARI